MVARAREQPTVELPVAVERARSQARELLRRVAELPVALERAHLRSPVPRLPAPLAALMRSVLLLPRRWQAPFRQVFHTPCKTLRLAAVRSHN